MGISYNTTIVRSGLVLHLDAANPKSYPGSGTTWKDLAGQDNNGTLVNGVGYSSASNGHFIFDGANDYTYGSDIGFPSGTGPLSVFSWIKTPSSYPSNPKIPILLHFGTTTYTNGFYFGWECRTETSAIKQYNVLVSNHGNQAYSNSKLQLNTLYYIGVTKPASSENYTFYINGVADGTNTWTGTGGYTSTNITLNGEYNISYNSSDLYWINNVYSVKVYNRALSAAEVKQNFEALRGRYGA